MEHSPHESFPPPPIQAMAALTRELQRKTRWMRVKLEI